MTIWWCEIHKAEQIDPRYDLCFRGPTVFPTIEAEQHQCRFVEMQLLPNEAVASVHDPNPTKHRGETLAYRQGVIDGKTEGFDVGYQQGYDQGYRAGDTDAAVVSIKHGVLGATTEELIRELWRRGTLHEVVDSLVPMKRRFVTDWTVS